MRIFTITTFLLLLFCLKEGNAQVPDPKCRRSTEGTDFWFGFIQGRANNNHYVEITVTGRESATFSIYIGGSSTPLNNQQYTIGANSSMQIRIPVNLVEPVLSEKVLPMGINLKSDVPVNVYALNHDNNSSDVAVIYPEESLGNAYFTMCYKPHVDWDNLNHGRNSEFAVVAAHDSTRITNTPSKNSDGGHPANTPFSILLNRGELFQVQSLSEDLTGSYIVSDKPVAVYAGSFSTTIPFETPNGGWDHMYEQMPPVKTWGREYYTVPLYGRSKDYFRIMACLDHTAVQIGNNPPFFLNRGEFHEEPLSVPTRIIADKPILVSQYSQSRSNDGVTNGDGFMVILSPVSQAKNDVTFVDYESQIVNDFFYVNIVVPVSEVNNIELNGSMLNSSVFSIYSNGRYASTRVQIPPGPGRLRNINPDRGFIAYVYGYGGNESYGYGVGFNLDLVLDIGKSIDFEGDTLALCKGSTLTLDAGPYFDDFRWKTGDTTQQILVTQEGKYALTASTIDGCVQQDSIYILLSDPQPRLGNDTVGCPFSKVLDPGGVFAKYEWSTGESTRNITVSQPGEYSVRVTDRYGCTAGDTLKLGFYPVPTVKLQGKQLLCGELSGTLTAEVTGGNNNWSYVPPPWKSDQPSRVKYDKPTGSSAGFTVPEWGKYTFIYSLTTTDHCVATDSLVTGIYQIPTSSFDFVDNPGDPCAGYSREIIYTGNATPAAKMNWDFGGCCFDSLDWIRRYVSFAPFGSQPFVSLYVEENGCVGDSTRKAFGASPDFKMNTDKSQACDSDLIRFSGTLNVPDQLNFEWDFGDGSGSTEQFPVHLYSSAGFYDVRLTITNPVTGCQAGFLVDDMVKIYRTPVTGFEVDYPVAFLGQSHLTFTNKTEYGDYYRWDFGDGSASEAASTSHTYVQAGKYPVSLMAESGMGCRDTSVMNVEILPSTLFTPNAFRPGSSIAENRVFMPIRSGVDPDNFHLQIFNRWGQQVFWSKSPDHPWDGKLKNGKDAPVGNYIWRVDYTDIQGFPHTQKGQGLLVR